MLIKTFKLSHHRFFSEPTIITTRKRLYYYYYRKPYSSIIYHAKCQNLLIKRQGVKITVELKSNVTLTAQLPTYQNSKIPISNETDRDKLSFGFWSHLTRFHTKYKVNAKTFLTSDCTFTQWRVPWWNGRLFAGSCLLPITTSHKLVPRQTRYWYYANWHP